MATSQAKKRSAAKKTPAPGKLTSFLHDVREEHPDFAFTRYWYQEKKTVKASPVGSIARCAWAMI
jgi:hypothetical protein